MKRLLSNLARSAALIVLILLAAAVPVAALGSSQNPQSSATGLEGRISSPPPTTGAVIGLPINGQTFTATPITVAGSCPDGLLVKLFSNNIFVGSTQCTGGSYTLRIDLFSGQNDLVARVYDALDQAGPDSNTVSVTFQDAQFVQFGGHVSLSSTYAKLGADPGTTLTWPVIVSGGTGPYALSVDWGDGSGAQPQSVPFAGTVNLTHVYKNAGVYKVIVQASDANGTAAFLQLVGVGNGKVGQAVTGGNTANPVIIRERLLWWPFLVFLPLMLVTFWLGKRYELLAIHRQLERQTSEYDQ